jgi:hypothetical protein
VPLSARFGPMFTELDPDVCWRAIEGYENELLPEHRTLEAYYKQFRCPRCGGECAKEFQAAHAFADKSVLTPRALLRCIACECLINPFDGMVLEIGKELIPSLGQDRWEHIR